jgi:hypothetical protein
MLDQVEWLSSMITRFLLPTPGLLLLVRYTGHRKRFSHSGTIHTEA